MLGAGLQFGLSRGEDRFYNPAKARRSALENDRLRRAHSDLTASRLESDEAKKFVCEPVVKVKPLSNLDRFLQAIRPSVFAQYPSKTIMKSFKACEGEFQPYFVLGDLWESFREWSAYGAGVPLVLNDKDSVVQYYVPYLSGIQIYVDSVKPSAKLRQPAEDSDSDFRDSSSDGSSEGEPERGLKYLRDHRNHQHPSEVVSHQMDRLSLGDHHNNPQDGFSSDDGEAVNSQGYLIFEYLERDPPFSREPLADKILDLAYRFPELLTLRSCDILPSSWISVAWYPIYRIPTGPTLKDLDACFLTFHSLHTPVGGSQGVQSPIVTCPSEMDGIPKMSLPVFGLASYKFKASMWTPNGGFDCQSGDLLQAAHDWLRELQVNHPDFLFFCR